MIKAKGLGKAFRYYENKWYKLRGAFIPTGNHHEEFWALRNVDLELPKGTTLAIIGPNGSGKTTLLQLLAGLLKPTEGKIEVHGNLATLLELQGGFQQDLTGRENIFVSCGLRGFSRKGVAGRIDEIIAFAELEKFIDHPIKHYSSGMLMRLAFATAVNVNPDVMLIDEVFAVGDMAFQHKCARKFRELQANGTTIVLATHDMMAVKSFAQQAILLNAGNVVCSGQPDHVTNQYLKLVSDTIDSRQNGQLAVSDSLMQKRESRHGTGEARITSIEILVHDKATDLVSFGDSPTFRFQIDYLQDVEESILGFYIRDRYGNDLIGVNTHEENQRIGSRKKGEQVTIDFKLSLHLREGSYSVSPGLAYHPTDPRYLDWIDNAAFFQMIASSRRIHGFMWVPTEITIRENR